MKWLMNKHINSHGGKNSNDTDDFDRFASEYRDIHNQNIKISGTTSEYFSEYKVKIVSELEFKYINDNLRILDLGCGDGNSIKYFRSYFPNSKIYGADISSKSIEVAKSKNLTDVQLLTFDGENIPYQSKFFDIIFLAGVIHHVPEDQRSSLLSEVYRVLGDQGRLYIFENNPHNPINRKIVRDCIFDENAVLISSRQLINFLSTIGFKKNGARYTIFVPRHKLFQPLWKLEKFIYWVPIGAQFFITSSK
jgi:ubiquinone/menaquinone biosynthesis C-methylase UbiE